MYITKQDFLFIKDNCFAKLIGLNTDLNAADESAKSRTTPTPCPSIVKDLCGSVTFREIFLAFCHKEPSVVPNETGVLHMSRDTVPCRGGLPLVCTHTLGFVGNFLWLQVRVSSVAGMQMYHQGFQDYANRLLYGTRTVLARFHWNHSRVTVLLLDSR